jgi:hypothetical protein
VRVETFIESGVRIVRGAFADMCSLDISLTLTAKAPPTDDYVDFTVELDNRRAVASSATPGPPHTATSVCGASSCPTPAEPGNSAPSGVTAIITRD